MIVHARPGTAWDELLRVLQHAHDAANRVQRSGSVKEQQDSYLAWVHESVRMLRRAVTTAELDRLVLTRRYWLIQAAPATDSLIRVIGTELDERQEQLKEALEDVQQQMRRWSRFSTFVVADTSFYLTHPEKIDELDFTHLLSSQWPHEEIHLLVPIIVLDELDKLKESGDQNRRWRASYTLAVLDRLLPDGCGPALLRREDFSGLQTGALPRAAITVEVVHDPPGHSRLPIDDNELIDRAWNLQTFAGDRRFTLITYDTGQSMRARAVGLQTVKLSAPEKPEPIAAGEGTGARAQRRQKRQASSALDDSTAPKSLDADKSLAVASEEER